MKTPALIHLLLSDEPFLCTVQEGALTRVWDQKVSNTVGEFCFRNSVSVLAPQSISFTISFPLPVIRPACGGLQDLNGRPKARCPAEVRSTLENPAQDACLQRSIEV